MFDWLYELFGTMLSFFNSITGSYALALLLYALVFKLVFLPFSIKQQKNQIAMAKLAPKIELIKAKYRGRTDQVTMRKQQEEILELQQKEGYSPLSGCLPLLLQMPLIIFLYNVIRKPLSYICKLGDGAIEAINMTVNTNLTEVVKIDKIDQITLIDSIHKSGLDSIAYDGGVLNVSDIPNFKLFGLSLAENPSFENISWLVLIPFIAAFVSWLSMFLTRKWNGNGMPAAAQDAQSAASMKMMDLMMPAMTIFFAFSFSAMLGIYWIYQSALSILQTFILSKVMPLPKYTDEELKAMKKAQKEAEKAQRAALKAQPKYKSLHYIDDDDYDELPTIKSPDEKDKKSVNLDSTPEIKD